MNDQFISALPKQETFDKLTELCLERRHQINRAIEKRQELKDFDKRSNDGYASAEYNGAVRNHIRYDLTYAELRRVEVEIEIVNLFVSLLAQKAAMGMATV